jgi:hypothetical protein
MALLTRSTLKNLFKRGSVPTEVNFADLIDSTVNKVDDGFAQDPEKGFMLSPHGENKRLISFFESMRDPDAAFSISLNPNNNKGLSFNDSTGDSVLFLRDGGYVGVGTTLPNYRLEVNGMAGMAGRIGTFMTGQVPADGRWHPVLLDLEGVQAFEVVAQAGGRLGRGKYAFTHAIAVSVYGKGNIQQLKASFGWFFQKIKFRWRKEEGTDNTFRLEVRTSGNYGFLDEEEKQPAQIRFYIMKLWDANLHNQNNKFVSHKK